MSDQDFLAGCFWALAVAALGVVELLHRSRRLRVNGDSGEAARHPRRPVLDKPTATAAAASPEFPETRG